MLNEVNSVGMVEAVRQALEEPIKGKRSRGRQLKRCKDGLRDRLQELGLKEQGSQDRQKWKRGVVVTDPQLSDKVQAKKMNQRPQT